MKDHTFNARNDEMRARMNRARKADATAPVESPTSYAEPSSMAALADATDLAIRAMSPAPHATATKKKKAAKATTAPQAAASDAPVVAPPETAPDAPTKKARNKKEPKAIADTSTPPTKTVKVDRLDNGLERTGKLTVDALARAWIAHLDEGGKTTASTIASYGNDLKTAIAFFGADQLASTIDRGSLERFNGCDGVMKLRSGEPKAQPTILKMRRAFRMALEWARENEIVEYVDKR